MLIVVAVAMLRAAMLVLVAVLMVIATLHLQDQDKPASSPSPVPAQRANEEKKPRGKRVNMCVHLYAFNACHNAHICITIAHIYV